MGIDIRGAVGKFMQIGLSQQYHTRCQEAVDGCGVMLGNKMAQDLGSGSGSYAAREEKVLEADWDAVQGTSVSAMGDFLFCPFCLCQRQIGSHGNVGVQVTLSPINPGQQSVRDFDRRNPAPANQRSKATYAKVASIAQIHPILPGMKVTSIICQDCLCFKMGFSQDRDSDAARKKLSHERHGTDDQQPKDLNAEDAEVAEDFLPLNCSSLRPLRALR
jgi:hypothetical protein